ncbi:unnamed protein product, partial [Brassica oleracea var. botrytis]
QPLFCTAESEIVLEGLRCSLRSNKKKFHCLDSGLCWFTVICRRFF